MARLQFKVTFTNAQPGAPVEILTPSTEHVYPSATTVNPVGGKQLYLDGTNSIIVWSDAQAVIAQTLDGTGSFIQGTATGGSPTITVGDGTAPTNPPGSAAYSPAARLGTRWVPWGDSITYGSDNVALPTRGVSYPTYAGIASGQRLNMVYNAGVPGDRSDQILARFTSDVAAHTPNVVTICAGRNDISQSITLAAFQANILAMIAAVRGIGATPVVCTIPPTLSAPFAQNTRTWNKWLRGYCTSNGILLVDFYAALVDPATGSYLAAYDSGDHIHPNEAGYSALGVAVWNALQYVTAPLVIPTLRDNADTDNMLQTANPLFLTTTLSTQHPTSWNGTGDANVTGSYVTGDTSIFGNWYRMTFAASAGDYTINKVLTGVTGHVYAYTGLIKTNLSAAAAGGSVFVQIGKGSGTAYAAAGLGTTPVNGRFWIVFTALGTGLNPQVFVKAGATGTVDVAELAVYDLTALGIDSLVA